METFYIILIGMLLLLAIFDLIVGVSNDAVNFLNSAIGSRAFNPKFLIALAGIGVFFGATFSTGMMDIARHGIFQPQYYTFAEVATIFISVMLTDVILLDTFNNMGMPTSTTVSMVFELLGASIAIAIIKLSSSNTGLNIGDLINTEKALSVILAIFVSVAIAFTVGLIVQWISRLIFTFAYKKNLKYFIGIFSGISLTAILYFILVKGLKNMAFVSSDFREFITTNELAIVLTLFLVLSIISQLLHAFHINMFKVIIAFGTFALALAFAGNDLVNFIGVPLAGVSSLSHLMQDGGDPQTYLMTPLLKSEPGQWYFLFVAGCIMVCALTFSKKTKKVLNTSVSLASQNSSDEIFGSNPIARATVRCFNALSKSVASACPKRISTWVNSRFNSEEMILEKNDAAFDLIRASVNLMLASSLIALGTSFKLPLSTTYVTFMVAMGTSLADRAWNREIAVYRITGVFSVIGGWFATAFVAFACASIVATLLFFGGIPAKFFVFALVIWFLIRSMIHYREQRQDKNSTEALFDNIIKSAPETDVFPLIQDYSRKEWHDTVTWESDCYKQIIEGFLFEDLNRLRTVSKKLNILVARFEKVRRQGTICSKFLAEEDMVVKNFFLYQVIDFIGNTIIALKQIEVPCKAHVSNGFTPLERVQKRKLVRFMNDVCDSMDLTAKMILDGNFEEYENIREKLSEVSRQILTERKTEMLRHPSDNIRGEILYLKILYESKSMIDGIASIAKSSRKFLTDKSSRLTSQTLQ